MATQHPSRRSATVRWAFALVVVAIATAAVMYLSSPGDNPNDLHATEIVVPSAHGLMSRAVEVARQWRPDAYLIGIYVDLLPITGLSFGFDSPSDPRVTLNVHFPDPSDPSPDAREIRSEGRQVVQPSVEEAAGSRVDSPEAFSTALNAGGRAFIREHAEARYWFLSLQYVTDQDVAWRVVFSNGEFDNVSFEAMIDPKTGEVIDVREAP